VAFTTTAGFSLLGLPPTGVMPTLGGYNLCYIRPQANLAAVTTDEYQAPVVASWNAGNGRVLCFTGEADGNFSGDFAKWSQAGEFYATLTRWIAGKHEPLPEDLLLTQSVQDGVCHIQLHLDPTRKNESFTSLPRVRILHGLPGTAPAHETATMEWRNADLLEAIIPIAGAETVLNTVEITGQKPVTLPPVCLPYSPEFAPDHLGRGVASLQQIALTTGGRERIDLSKIWADLPINSRYVEIAPWLLVAAAILFLLEIFERRTGWMARLFAAKRFSAEVPSVNEEILSNQRNERVSPIKPQSPKAAAPSTKTSETKPIIASSAAPEADLDSFRKARERASRRGDRR
jgi:hypothetical protein